MITHTYLLTEFYENTLRYVDEFSKVFCINLLPCLSQTNKAETAHLQTNNNGKMA